MAAPKLSDIARAALTAEVATISARLEAAKETPAFDALDRQFRERLAHLQARLEETAPKPPK